MTPQQTNAVEILLHHSIDPVDIQIAGNSEQLRLQGWFSNEQETIGRWETIDSDTQSVKRWLGY